MVVAVLVLIAGLATAPLARSGAAARSPRVAHLPGQPAYVRPTPPFRFRVWVVAAALSIVLTVVAIVAAPAFEVAAAILGLVVLAMITAILRRYATGCAEVRAAVDAFAPLVAFPYAGKVGIHIGMWSPWVERTGLPWVIVARGRELFDQLAQQYPGVPIVQDRIPSSVRVALYTHGAAKNSAFIEASDATHVFLGHGDSDKPLSASERVLQYDVVAVAGQAAIDRFVAAGLDVPADRLRIIGRPQTEGIRRASGGGRASGRPPVVLYAPTWRHADDELDVSSLRVADRLVQALLDRGCTVVFRRHFAGQNHVEAEAMIVRVNQMLEAAGPQHTGGAEAMDMPLIDAFNSVDAMISDVSGIVVDFLASGKPLVVYAAQFTDVEEFRASHPTARAAYVLDRDLARLDDVLDQALGDDPLADVRAERADEYLGGSDRDDPGARFIALVEELAQR